MELGDDFEMIFDYFEELYIGKIIFIQLHVLPFYCLGCLRRNNIRRKPLFSIDFWNMFNRTTQASVRTNNAAETYHRQIGSVMQCTHPSLWISLQKLIDEENSIHSCILHIKAGQPQRKTKNQRFEERLLNVISNPPSDIMAQIDAVAYHISL